MLRITLKKSDIDIMLLDSGIGKYGNTVEKMK